MLTVGSLCSGYGGIELALSDVLDVELAWYAEYDDAPARVMAAHHPGVPNHRDITTLDWESLSSVDILTAGFPCQPFSHAGKRAGANDERHLWLHISDAIGTLRPRLVMLENVRGLLSAQGEPDTPEIVALERRRDQLAAALSRVETHRSPRVRSAALRVTERRRRVVAALRRARARIVRAIGAVLRDLANLGYDARWYSLRAADVGAAHGRFRVFIFAWPADSSGDTWGILHRNGRAAADADHSGSQGQQGEAGAASTGRHGHPEPGAGRPHLTLLPTPAVNDMGEGKDVMAWDAWTADMQDRHGNGNGHGKSLAIEAQRLFRTPTAQLGIMGGSQHPEVRKAGGHGPTLSDEVEHLLPTPRATDGTKGGPNQRGSSGDLMLPSAVTLLHTPTRQDCAASGGGYNGQNNVTLTDAAVRQPDRWGDYAAAIARAERACGRPAPAPTEPGPKGGRRLSPRFVEWLMMLPEGYVTAVAGLTRNDTLKALGNGVVPRQAAAALSAFIADMAEAVAA